MIKPRATQKLPECDRCLLRAHEPFLVCAVHPFRPEGDSCLDFRPDLDLENKCSVDFLGLQRQQRDGEPYSNSFDQETDAELWEPEGARFVNEELMIGRSFYNGEEIIQPRQRWTPEEQLWLLDNHPLFTGVCPECGYRFTQSERQIVHFDCPRCSWVDDSV